MLLFLVTSGSLVKCNNPNKCTEKRKNDLQVNNNLINVRINALHKRQINNNEYSDRYQYGQEKFYVPRDKRTAKKHETVFSSRRRFQELKSADIMTADGQPKLEPSLGDGVRHDQPHFGGIKMQQSFNKHVDKMQQLKEINLAGKEQTYIKSGTECNFDKPCSWKWNSNDEFIITSSDFHNEYKIGPEADPFGNVDGKSYLFNKRI